MRTFAGLVVGVCARMGPVGRSVPLAGPEGVTGLALTRTETRFPSYLKSECRWFAPGSEHHPRTAGKWIGGSSPAQSHSRWRRRRRATRQSGPHERQPDPGLLHDHARRLSELHRPRRERRQPLQYLAPVHRLRRARRVADARLVSLAELHDPGAEVAHVDPLQLDLLIGRAGHLAAARHVLDPVRGPVRVVARSDDVGRSYSALSGPQTATRRSRSMRRVCALLIGKKIARKICGNQACTLRYPGSFDAMVAPVNLLMQLMFHPSVRDGRSACR